MHLRPIVLGAVLVVLASPQGSPWRRAQPWDGDAWRYESRQWRSAATGAVLQQIVGSCSRWLNGLKWALDSDQTLQLITMLEQVAAMTTKLVSGTLGADTATQLDGMRARLTEIQKALAALMSAPPAKP